MSRAATKKRRNKPAAQQRAARRSDDRGVYGAILLIWAFVLFLWFVLANESFSAAVVGSLIAVFGWINFVAIKVYFGAKIPRWQRALAKLPLAYAGYGTEQGKPLEAAKGQAAARNVILISLLVSVGIVLLAAGILLG